MSIRIWTAAAVLAASLLAGMPAADAGVSRDIVRGKLDSSTVGGSEKGQFRLISGDRGNGSHFERIETTARHLDMTADTQGAAPVYHVWLVTSDASAEADFGAMRTNQRGNAGFVFDTRHTELPSGVTSITDYSGGTIEIRNGSTAVAQATIPEFGDRTFGHDRAALRSTSTTFRGRGEIVARHQSVPSGDREELRVTCNHMTASSSYTVVAIASDTTETTLGTFTTGSPLAIGGFRLATAKGDTIPGGGVTALAGQTVEVRDSGNSAVLRGTFPTIP